jgi:tetratricopeptide (TPR) repeat protein
MEPISFRTLVAAMLGCALAAGVARGDDVFVKSGPKAEELPFKNVTITRMKDGELYFTLNNRETHRPIGETRLELTGETQFNAAEKAFAEGRYGKDDAVAKSKFSDAVNGYSTTLSSTNKPWLKEFAGLRLQVAAPRSGRFDIALQAWMTMVEKDPAAASKAKPTLDGLDPKSAYLINGAKALAVAAGGAAKPDARRTYLELLGDVQTAMGDNEGAAKTLETRVMLGGSPDEVNEIMVRLARTDLADKKYDPAIERLKKVNMAALSDPARAEVTFIQAECKAAKLVPTSAADEWKDLAIDYMKVVAGYPTSPDAGPALLKVAEIHETLKDPETALKIYQQVAREHANTPVGQAAQKGIERLGKTAARN